MMKDPYSENLFHIINEIDGLQRQLHIKVKLIEYSPLNGLRRVINQGKGELKHDDLDGRYRHSVSEVNFCDIVHILTANLITRLKYFKFT